MITKIQALENISNSIPHSLNSLNTIETELLNLKQDQNQLSNLTNSLNIQTENLHNLLEGLKSDFDNLFMDRATPQAITLPKSANIDGMEIKKNISVKPNDESEPSSENIRIKKNKIKVR